MASYKILFKRSAERELRKIPSPYLKKILEKIDTLSTFPRPSGAILLRGENRHYRIRQGDYRIIYDVDDTNNTVTVIKIGHRREIYE